MSKFLRRNMTKLWFFFLLLPMNTMFIESVEIYNYLDISKLPTCKLTCKVTPRYVYCNTEYKMHTVYV